jgi:phage N-6-adenine-methyltransferase
VTAAAARRGKLAATLASARTAGSSSRDDWQTPAHFLERVRQIAPIGLDPCTSADNPVGADVYLTERENGLEHHWNAIAPAGSLAFVNPPYSKMRPWATKIASESLLARESIFGLEIVSLVGARPGSRWFDLLVWQTAAAVCFVSGRLRFVGAPTSAPFPSCVTYHGPRPWSFEAAFHDAGKVLRL